MSSVDQIAPDSEVVMGNTMNMYMFIHFKRKYVGPIYGTHQPELSPTKTKKGKKASGTNKLRSSKWILAVSFC